MEVKIKELIKEKKYVGVNNKKKELNKIED